MLSSLRNMIGSLIHNKSYPFLHQSGFRNHHSTNQTKKEVTQGCVLRLLLFLIYVNDLHSVVQYPDIYHFADTNLLYSSKPLKGINKKVNFELKNVVRWLRANKGSLNARKTDLIFFRSKRKQMKKHMKFTISGQKLGLLATQNTSSYY